MVVRGNPLFFELLGDVVKLVNLEYRVQYRIVPSGISLLSGEAPSTTTCKSCKGLYE
jgi:hypothetical protein